MLAKQNTFHLKLSDDSLTVELLSAQHIKPNIFQDIDIHVSSTLSQTNNITTLQLDYVINIPDIIASDITWHRLNKDNILRSDYLWENTCLECFIGLKNSTKYIEINGSTKGEYAAYHFSKYRTPEQLPPPYYHDIKFQWLDMPTSKQLICKPYINNHHIFTRTFCCEMIKINMEDIIKLHPCVILNYKNQPLFFATQHSKPADFHNSRFWTTI